MKPGTLVVRTLFFLLLLVLSTPKLPLLASAEHQVVDAFGQPIFSGGEYYIIAAIYGAGGGGVKPGITNDEESSGCPVSVIQEDSDLENGEPVKFSTVPGITPGPGIIFTGTELEIAFTKTPECAESSEWTVFSGNGNKSWVGIGGPKAHPEEKLVNGTFKIEKSGFPLSYKLVFCPTETASAGLCSDVGIDYNNGTRRLVLVGDGVFQVIFLNVLADDAKSFNYIKQVVAQQKM